MMHASAHHSTRHQVHMRGSGLLQHIATYKPVRIRKWHQHDVHEIGRLWEEALLVPGLTSFGKAYDPDTTPNIREATLAALKQMSARKQQAGQKARELRAQLALPPQPDAPARFSSWPSLPSIHARPTDSDLKAAQWCVLKRYWKAAQLPLGISKQTEGNGCVQFIHVRDVSGNRLTDNSVDCVDGSRLELQRLRRRRLWACLVAEAVSDPCSSELQTTPTTPSTDSMRSTDSTLTGASQVSCQSLRHNSQGHGTHHYLSGYIILRVSHPLSLLPPPWPTTTPPVLQVDALAVCCSMRRQGVASVLLDAAERLARVWRQASLWLEVDATNLPAVQLYVGRGYRVVRSLGWPWRHGRKLILCKSLVVNPAGQTTLPTDNLASYTDDLDRQPVTAITPSKGKGTVFVWDKNVNGR